VALLLSLLFAGGTSAQSGSPQIAVLTKGGPLASGSPVLWTSADALRLATGAGSIECAAEAVTLEGSFEEPAQGHLGAAHIAGCVSTFSFGEGELTAAHLPWSFALEARTAAHRGGITVTAAGGVGVTATFPASSTTCTYVAKGKKLRFAFALGTRGSPEPVRPGTTGAAFELVKQQSGASCPHEAALTLELALTATGEALEAEYTGHP